MSHSVQRFIDYVSRFSKKHGYREGLVFSDKFSHALALLAEAADRLREKKNPRQEQKDRDAYHYS